MTTGSVWPRIVWVSAVPWPVPPKLSADLPRAPFPIQSFPYQSLVDIPSLPDRAPTYNCSALSFINLDLIQNWPPRTCPGATDKDHKIYRRFLFGIKLRYTLLVIQLFVNFLALLQSQSYRFSVIWHLAFNW